MIQIEEVLKQELDKAENFFRTSCKNEKCYYKLYTVKYADSKYSGHDLRRKNFQTDSIEESLIQLERDIREVGTNGQQFLVVKNYSIQTDPTPIELRLINPFFNPNLQKGYRNTGIHGTSENLNGVNNMMFDLMQSHHSSTTDLQKQLLELNHNHQIQKLEERIEGLEDDKRTNFDAISDFFQTETGKTIVGGLMGIIQANAAKPQPLNQTPDREEEPKQQQQSDNSEAETDQQEKISKLNASLQRLDKVFNGEGLEALHELAIFCQNNPVQAQMFRGTNNTQNEQV